MKIDIQRIGTDFHGSTCFVHARGAVSPEGLFRITMQPLRLSGDDVFYGMRMLESFDRGQKWEEIRESKTLIRYPAEDNMELVLCDATPMFHKKTGKWLETGIGAYYLNDEQPDGGPRCTLWTVYDEETRDWSVPRKLMLPDMKGLNRFNGSGCGQCVELPDGDVLIPIGRSYPGDPRGHQFVARCSFDGKELKYIEEGNAMTVDVPRGLGEGSIMDYQGRFFLCLRNDESGYVTVSDDGLHYADPVPLCFDDGSNVGNYNTQQHWIRGGGKLYMVYTRRGLNNDHVFRHRAPLVIAEFDPEKMCLIRETEQIVVPERGARLGNFGCTYVNENESYVIASEWMQPIGCEQYGSDNSIYVTRLTFGG